LPTSCRLLSTSTSPPQSWLLPAQRSRLRNGQQDMPRWL
jgi:hypothetical protein